MKPKDIEKAIKECTSEIILRDSTGERGVGVLTLVVRKTSLGVSAIWTGEWWVQGKKKKKALGRYPYLGLQEARSSFAEKVRAPLTAGKNPQHAADKHARPTVEALFQSYIAELRRQGKVSADNFEFTLLRGKTNCADGIGRHKLAADVTPDDVIVAIRQWYARGCRRQADIARSNMVAAFNHALLSAHSYTSTNRAEWGLKTNPALAVKKDTGAVQARDRNLSAEEIREFWDGLNDYSFTDDMADLFRLLLLCGQRVRETLRLDSHDLDLDTATWNMPRHKTKGGKYPHSVPLPALAMPILRQLVERNGPGPLFPGGKGGHRDRLGEMSASQSLRRWCKEYGFTPFQPRDLRRTWKSRTGDAGIGRFERDLIQQHARGDTGSIHYDRFDYLPQMRTAMDTWNDWLAQVLQLRDG